MALTFTDNQIRELTGQVINSDLKIADLQQEKTKIAKIKSDYLSLDNQEKVFTDHWMSCIAKFHAELKHINSTDKTNYVGQSVVESSAKLEPTSLHFPTGYLNFKPKLGLSNVGLPQTVLTDPNEIINLNYCLDWTNRIVNGFTGQNISGTGIYTTGQITITGTIVGTPTAGEYITAYNSGAGIWGTVASYSSVTSGVLPDTVITTQTIVINILNSYGSLSGTVSWDLSKAGYSEAVRISTSTDGFLLLCKNMIDTYKANVKTYVTNENAELSANDSKEDKVQIDTANNSNTTFISNLDSWSANTGQLRFNNANLNLLNGYLNTRSSYLPTRITQITTSLGSISQVTNGDFTGSGRYFDLFNSIMLRTHKTTGHLRNYYQQGLLGQNTDEKIYIATTQANRDKSLATVRLLSQEPTNTPIIELKDISNLSVNDSVNIMDNAYTVVNKYTVTEIILPNKVRLSDVVPSMYKMDSQARLVKMT